MLRSCLSTSSAHGFPYLASAKGLPARLMWALCILVAVVGAVIVITLNIMRWSSSPAVVTTVASASIEVC